MDGQKLKPPASKNFKPQKDSCREITNIVGKQIWTGLPKISFNNPVKLFVAQKTKEKILYQ
jgi:hypothetical protein